DQGGAWDKQNNPQALTAYRLLLDSSQASGQAGHAIPEGWENVGSRRRQRRRTGSVRRFQGLRRWAGPPRLSARDDAAVARGSAGVAPLVPEGGGRGGLDPRGRRAFSIAGPELPRSLSRVRAKAASPPLRHGAGTIRVPQELPSASRRIPRGP